MTRAGGGLLHPGALVAILVLVLNDHVLKQAFPGVVTGKLSDVAGLVFFPLALQATWELGLERCGRWSAPSRRTLVVAVVLTGIGFALANGPGDALYRWGLGALQWPVRGGVAILRGGALPAIQPVAHVADLGDLLTLPALGIALRIGRSR
jgi:hypothetical protein